MPWEIDDERLGQIAKSLGRRADELRKEIAAAATPRARFYTLDRAARREQERVEREAEKVALEREARAARTRYEQERREADHRLAEQRRGMSLGARLNYTIDRARVLAQAKTTAIDADRVSHGKAGSRLLTAADIQSDTLDRYAVVLERIIGNFERAVDREARSPLESVPRALSGEERDLELLADWEGERSEVVAALAPHLGSARTIENARARLLRRRVDGLPLPPALAARGTRIGVA